MKICVLGLDGVSLELFADERMANLRRIMDTGVYGALRSVPGCSFVGLWESMAQSRQPAATDEGNCQTTTRIWEVVAEAGKRVILAGVAQKEARSNLGRGNPSGASSNIQLPSAIIALPSEVDSGSLQELLAGEWGYLQVLKRIENIPSDLHDFDECLGTVLESIDDQTIILVLAHGKTGESTAPAGETSDMFTLAAPNCLALGEYRGAHLLDIAPTLLDLAGYGVPATMEGRSLAATCRSEKEKGSGTPSDEQLLHDRLAGLGYV
jgi:hypothetical protein